MRVCTKAHHKPTTISKHLYTHTHTIILSRLALTIHLDPLWSTLYKSVLEDYTIFKSEWIIARISYLYSHNTIVIAAVIALSIIIFSPLSYSFQVSRKISASPRLAAYKLNGVDFNTISRASGSTLLDDQPDTIGTHADTMTSYTNQITGPQHWRSSS